MSSTGGARKIELGPTGRRVAQRVHEVRLARGLTFVDLAGRLEDLGWNIPEIGLRRIESEARRVTVDDLFALSVALEVSPLDLLLGGTWHEGATALPDDVNSDEARAWVAHGVALDHDSRLDYWLAESTRIMDELSAYADMEKRAQNHAVRRIAQQNLDRLGAEHSAAVARIAELRPDGDEAAATPQGEPF